MSMRAYQRSRFDISANRCIASRYERVTVRLIDLRCFASKPRSRPATAKLATSRLTSHSNGPGSVSSKSLMLKIRRRSGAPKTPKFDRWASPHSCTCSPVRAAAREIGRHQVRGAAVERERRHQHPPVADRNELGHAGCGLLLEQIDRVEPVRRRLPFAVPGTRRQGPRGLAPRRPLADGEVDYGLRLRLPLVAPPSGQCRSPASFRDRRRRPNLRGCDRRSP